MAESTTWAMPIGGGISGGKIGLTGTSAYIDVARAKVRMFVPSIEVTDADDSAPQFASLGYVYGTLAVIGWLIQGQKAGLASGDFASGTSIAVTFTLDTGRTVSGSVLLEESDATWIRGRARDPISFSGKFTGTITEA